MKCTQHILIIDDEEMILKNISTLLKIEGFEVSTAENAFVALKLLAENTYDAVVCDYTMPNMDGITLLRQIRKDKNYIPFVFFSGNADENHGIEMKSLGAYEFIKKPHIELLADVLTKTLIHNERKKLVNSDFGEDDEFSSLLYGSKK